MTIKEIFILTGSIQGIVFSILLFLKSKKQKTPQNICLGVFILLFSIVVLKGWYIGSENYLKFPQFLFLPIYISFGIGPAFYFYTNFLLDKEFKFDLRKSLHLFPAMLQLAYQLVIFLRPVEARIVYFQNEYFFTFLPIEEGLGIISLGFYYFFSYKILKKYQDSISDTRQELYKWLNHFVWVSYLMLCSWVFISIIDFAVYDYTQSYRFYYPIYIFMISILFWIVYRGFISTNKILPYIVNDTNGKSYSISEKEAETYILSLKDVMENEKLFLKPKLSLNELAEILDINSKYLSQIINKKFNKSYTEYLNTYRIDYAKKELLLIKNTNLTIAAISEKCGFNSKSTFNDVFKKITKQTPTEFIRYHS
jgi:AraC-like DNA-binding protein